MGSSWSRDRTCVPCTGRRILNHCATREVPVQLFILSLGTKRAHPLLAADILKPTTLPQPYSSNFGWLSSYFIFTPGEYIIANKLNVLRGDKGVVASSAREKSRGSLPHSLTASFCRFQASAARGTRSRECEGIWDLCETWCPDCTRTRTCSPAKVKAFSEAGRGQAANPPWFSLMAQTLVGSQQSFPIWGHVKRPIHHLQLVRAEQGCWRAGGIPSALALCALHA